MCQLIKTKPQLRQFSDLIFISLFLALLTLPIYMISQTIEYSDLSCAWSIDNTCLNIDCSQLNDTYNLCNLSTINIIEIRVKYVKFANAICHQTSIYYQNNIDTIGICFDNNFKFLIFFIILIIIIIFISDLCVSCQTHNKNQYDNV